MLKIGSEPQDARLVQALGSVRSALQLLDEADAPPEIGAHLDLAICRLEAVVGSTSGGQVAAIPRSTSSK